MLTFTAVMDACVCVREKTMFLLARYTVAAAVFLSASAASAVEDATPSADYLPAVSMLPACKAFIADVSPRDIYVLFEARPERMHEDFRVLAVEAMQKAWPCK